MLRIGLDIDDCLCYWKEAYNIRFNTDKYPKYLQEQVITKNVFRILRNERDFWLNLKVKNRPNFTPTLYCTSRVNNKLWTKKWLADNKFPKSPVYQIQGYGLNKANWIKGKVDVFIDDSVLNMTKMNRSGLPCLLYATPHNSWYQGDNIVHNLEYDEIEQCYHKFITQTFKTKIWQIITKLSQSLYMILQN